MYQECSKKKIILFSFSFFVQKYPTPNPEFWLSPLLDKSKLNENFVVIGFSI